MQPHTGCPPVEEKSQHNTSFTAALLSLQTCTATGSSKNKASRAMLLPDQVDAVASEMSDRWRKWPTTSKNSQIHHPQSI
eukprot:2805129-Amphidinium_carterae.2